jgi:ethanolamine ammonia-lyase large subunit
MLYLRSAFGVRAAPEFEAWLERMDMVGAGGHIRELSPKGSDIARMLAFPKASQ